QPHPRTAADVRPPEPGRRGTTVNTPDGRLDELRDLLGTHRDGELTEAQASRLDELLAGDAEAQRVYAEYIDLCVTLRHYQGVPAGDPAARPAAAPPSPLPRRARWVRPLLVAAVILLTFGLGVASGLRLRSPAPRPEGDEYDGPPGVAVLTRVVDADWEPTAL